MRISPWQYARFMMVGVAVGVFTVACRSAIGWALGADTAFHYSISVVLAYSLGIVLSFGLNGQFTFKKSEGQRSWAQFLLFVLIALVGMLATWLFSLGLRYGLKLDSLAGRYGASLAFATGAVLASAVTYPLNARLVFGRRAQQRPLDALTP